MKKLSKIMLSLAICVAMVLSLLPFKAQANSGNWDQYVTIDYGATSGFDHDVDVYINVDGVQVASGRWDYHGVINSIEITIKDGYKTQYGFLTGDVTQKMGTMSGKWVNDELNRFKATFTAGINQSLTINLRTKYTVSVAYDYLDNSESNPAIETKAAYTDYVLKGGTFESRSFDQPNYKAKVVKGDASYPDPVMHSNTFDAKGVNSNLSYTVQMDPQNKDSNICIDRYIDGDLSTLGLDIFVDTIAFNGYELSNHNAQEKTYLIDHFAVQDPVKPYMTLQYQGKWYDFSKSSIGLGWSTLENVEYISRDKAILGDASTHNWAYSYYWTTPGAGIFRETYEWRYPVGEGNTIPIPDTEQGRINFIFDLHTPNSDDDTHVWVLDEDASKDPTCVEDGVNVYYCSHCKENGYTNTYSETVPALGHLYDGQNWIDMNDEQHYMDCARCGEAGRKTDVHHYPDNPDEHKDPTVDVNGYDRYYCIECHHLKEIELEIGKRHLYYNANGGVSAPVDETKYIENDTATLSGVATAEDDDKVVFMGWSKDQVFPVDAPIVTAADNNSVNYATSVTFASGDDFADITVYAVWAEDQNNNDKPDFDEDKYSLTYDVNGGKNGPATETGILAQDDYPLNNEVVPEHDKVDGVDVLFIGWTEQVDTKIYSAEDTAPKCITTVDITGNTTVYAVYGYDTNGNNKPDVLEEKYTLIYDANGGSNGPDDVNDLVEQEDYELTDEGPKHADQNGESVIFIGWTEEADKKIYTKDDANGPETIKTIDITGDDPEIIVYAVYGLDANGNNIPDVYEDKFDLNYNANGGDDDSVPDKELDLLPETGHPLNMDVVPTHEDKDGVKVLFVGWTKEADTKIYANEDMPPVTIDKVDIVDEDVTVYAVYGYDTNENDIPDVLEGWANLYYDPNGGNNDGPATERVLDDQKGYGLKEEGPTHRNDEKGNPVVFIGWTEEADPTIYTKNDDAPETITKVDINGDTTVYAVYGLDTNGNGTADVLETWVTLTYDANGGKDAPAAETKALGEDGKAYFDITKDEPTREGYTFKGWSTTKDGKVEVVAGGKVYLTADGSLYAVWEKVEDVPDVPGTGEEDPDVPDVPGTGEEDPDVPNVPDTGDHAMTTLWAIVAMMSFAAMIVLLGYKKRQKN